MKTLTYGVLPLFKEFNAAFKRECPRGSYNIGGGPLFRPPEWYPELRDYTAKELWAEIARLMAIADGFNDECGRRDRPDSLASDILGTLGFEWV